jgi:UDP-N-acetylglucosamine acyltransferase
VARVHSTAVVDPRAKLAEDAIVGPYCVIGESVELAAGVEVVAHAWIGGRTTVGAGTRIFPFAVLGTPAQVHGDDAPCAQGRAGSLVIGEHNVIREHVSIHAGSRAGGGCTRIGSHNMIMNNVHVAHDCTVGSHAVLAAYAGLSGHVEVADHVFLGGMTGVHQHVRIGESAFTGGGSRLVKDAPPFTRVAGDRARFLGMNRVGLERRGLPQASIEAVARALRLLFRSRLRLAAALARVEDECGGVPEVARLLDFLRRSERGFIR